jgi:hypothetical protein
MSSGRVYEKVRQLIVHILKEHKLTNNFKTNITSNQQPSDTYNTTAVFEISEPWLSDGSISGKIKTAKNYAATWGSVSQEIFPQRVMGALADLYIVLFALYGEDIPKDKKYLIDALNSNTILNNVAGETDTDVDAEENVGAEKKVDAEKKVVAEENVGAEKKVDAEKKVVAEENVVAEESENPNTPSISDTLLSQMFTTLLRKKIKTYNKYKAIFTDLKSKANADTENAKKFLQTQILYIIETVGYVNGGMRKTRKSKSKIGSRRRNKKSPGHKKSKKHRRKSYRNRRR